MPKYDDEEIQPDGSKIRDIEQVATTKGGHRVEVFKHWNLINGTVYGGRVVVGKTGKTLVQLTGYEDRRQAWKWLKIALLGGGMLR